MAKTLRLNGEDRYYTLRCVKCGGLLADLIEKLGVKIHYCKVICEDCYIKMSPEDKAKL